MKVVHVDRLYPYNERFSETLPPLAFEQEGSRIRLPGLETDWTTLGFEAGGSQEHNENGHWLVALEQSRRPLPSECRQTHNNEETLLMVDDRQSGSDNHPVYSPDVPGMAKHVVEAVLSPYDHVLRQDDVMDRNHVDNLGNDADLIDLRDEKELELHNIDENKKKTERSEPSFATRDMHGDLSWDSFDFHRNGQKKPTKPITTRRLRSGSLPERGFYTIRNNRYHTQSSCNNRNVIISLSISLAILFLSGMMTSFLF